MRKLLVYLKKYRKESILGPLFKLLEATLELLVPLVMAKIIDVGIAGGDRRYIVQRCLILAGLGIVGLAFSITAQYFAAKASVGFVKEIRHALFAHMQKFSYTEIDTLGNATMITRMTSDMNQVQSGMNLTLRLLLRSPFVVFGAMIMAFTIDLRAALVFAAAIPVLSVVIFGIMLISIPLYRKVQGRLDQVLGITRENLTGVRVIRAFCKEQEEAGRFRTRNEALTGQQKKVGRISALLNPLTYVILNLAILVLIHVGALRVDAGILTQGAVVALYNYMSQILVELIKLANLIINITKAVACGNRVQAVLDTQSSMTDGTYGEEKSSMTDGTYAGEKSLMTDGTHGEEKTAVTDGTYAEEAAPGAGSRRKGQRTDLSDGKGQTAKPTYAIEFRHAQLRYKNAGEDSLSDIDLAVRPGETVGVIGGTGAGKSSFVNLIPRFYDVSEGQVLVDGVDVRDYRLDALRGKIGIVPQRAVLFAGTIRENMRWGKKDASDAEIEEALAIAQAKEVADQKGGLDFRIEQGGKNLSGGQRQRFTIARALVRRPEILILDDSASALDFATDAALRSAIRRMPSKPTVLIVSQRTSSIQYADTIVVLDDGKTAGIGTHEELLETCGVYREIYESQYKKPEAAGKG